MVRLVLSVALAPSFPCAFLLLIDTFPALVVRVRVRVSVARHQTQRE